MTDTVRRKNPFRYGDAVKITAGKNKGRWGTCENWFPNYQQVAVRIDDEVSLYPEDFIARSSLAKDILLIAIAIGVAIGVVLFLSFYA